MAFVGGGPDDWDGAFKVFEKSGMQIHQLVQGFSTGDATSNLALKIQDILRETECPDSRIFCLPENIGPRCRDKCFDVEEHRPYSSPESILLYHFGNASPLSEYYRNAPDRKVLIYHNITPSKYFRAVSPERADNLDRSHDDLASLSGCTDLSCAISDYNRQDLVRAGFKNIIAFPAWIDTSALRRGETREILHRYRDGHANLVFVGRVAPNKKIEDLLKLFYCLKKGNPEVPVRLLIVGSYGGMELYHSYLLGACRKLDLDEVVFTGHVSQQDLNAYYKVADAFVCASEHEGFCIPLLEASYFGVPIVSFDIPAIRETLAGAGVIIRKRDFPFAAETVREVLKDEDLKKRIVDGQRQRLQDFDERFVRKRVKAAIETVTQRAS